MDNISKCPFHAAEEQVASFQLHPCSLAHGCPWNSLVCSNAAANGHLELLQWAMRNGCPSGRRTAAVAAKNGHTKIVEWLRDGNEGGPMLKRSLHLKFSRTEPAEEDKGLLLAYWQKVHAKKGPEARYSHAAVIRHDQLILLGGRNHAAASPGGRLYCFSVEKNRWQVLGSANKQQHRYGHCAVDITTSAGKPCILLFGGKQCHDDRLCSKQVLLWDYRSQKSESLNTNNDGKASARFGHSGVWMESLGMAVFFGGCDAEGMLCDDLLCLELSDGAWRTEEEVVENKEAKKKAAMVKRPKARMHHSAVVFEGDMYVFGGQSEDEQALDDLWKWSSSTGQWTCHSSSSSSSASSSASSGASIMDQRGPAARWGHAAVVDETEGVMLVSGGRDKGKTFDDLWQYSFKEGRWRGPVLHIVTYLNNVKHKNKEKHKDEDEEESQTAIPAEGKVFHTMTKMKEEANGLNFVWFGGRKGDDGDASGSNELWKVRVVRADREDLWGKFLPDEIALKIFSYLPSRELYSVSQVCKLWEMVSMDDDLWEDVAKEHVPALRDQDESCTPECSSNYMEQVKQIFLQTQEQRKMRQEWQKFAPRTIKLVLVGDGGIGKTSLCMRYVEKRFPEDYVPTIYGELSGIRNTQPELMEGLELSLFDTAAGRDYSRLRPLSYQGCDVFLLAFSMSDQCSLCSIDERWQPEVHRYAPGVPVVMVGLKYDDFRGGCLDPKTSPRGGPVTEEQAAAVAKRIKAVALVICSAYSGMNVDRVFDTCVSAALGVLPPVPAKKEKGGACLLQ
ncbi:GTP-binding protein RHO4 [Balamuthia mandrillaris]